MALDRHTIASLEGSHYQVMRDRGEISERTHSNDAPSQPPASLVRTSLRCDEDWLFVCNRILMKLAVMGNAHVSNPCEGERGR